LPEAFEREIFLASAKSPVHLKLYTLAPNALAISIVLSSEPVSITIISSTTGFTLLRHLARYSSSFLTIIHKETVYFLSFVSSISIGPSISLILSAADKIPSSTPYKAIAFSIWFIASAFFSCLMSRSISWYLITLLLGYKEQASTKTCPALSNSPDAVIAE